MRISALIIDDSRLMRRILIRTLRESRLAEFRFVEAATEADDEWLINFCKSMLRYQANGWDLSEKQVKSLVKNLRRNRIKVSAVSEDDPKAKGFAWVWKRLQARHPFPPSVQFWHEGRCGRCGRLLSNPDSIQRGLGPECAGLMAAA